MTATKENFTDLGLLLRAEDALRNRLHDQRVYRTCQVTSCALKLSRDLRVSISSKRLQRDSPSWIRIVHSARGMDVPEWANAVWNDRIAWACWRLPHDDLPLYINSGHPIVIALVKFAFEHPDEYRRRRDLLNKGTFRSPFLGDNTDISPFLLLRLDPGTEDLTLRMREAVKHRIGRLAMSASSLRSMIRPKRLPRAGPLRGNDCGRVPPLFCDLLNGSVLIVPVALRKYLRHWRRSQHNQPLFAAMSTRKPFRLSAVSQSLRTQWGHMKQPDLKDASR
jgi:hypothetical protein